MAMDTGMAMMLAAQARRRRDERGRYMGNGQGNMPEIRRLYNRRMEDEGAEMRSPAMGGEGYFVWDGPEHMPPERYGRPENRVQNTTTPPRYYSPYVDQPDVYKRQERENDTSNRMRMEGGNIVDLDTFAHKTDPLDQRDGKEHMMQKPQHRTIGFQSNSNGLDKQTVMEWVEGMEDADGVKGGKYSWHQAQQYAMNKGITGERRMLEFYAAMNAMYSDFHEVGKKFGVDRPEFYACLAKAFIEDPDAVDDKMDAYYKHVVRHTE